MVSCRSLPLRSYLVSFQVFFSLGLLFLSTLGEYMPHSSDVCATQSVKLPVQEFTYDICNSFSGYDHEEHCSRYCTSFGDLPGTDIQCIKNRITVNCSQALPPGTIVVARCISGFISAFGVKSVYTESTCYEGGIWSTTIKPCVPGIQEINVSVNHIPRLTWKCNIFDSTCSSKEGNTTLEYTRIDNNKWRIKIFGSAEEHVLRLNFSGYNLYGGPVNGFWPAQAAPYEDEDYYVTLESIMGPFLERTWFTTGGIALKVYHFPLKITNRADELIIKLEQSSNSPRFEFEVCLGGSARGALACYPQNKRFINNRLITKPVWLLYDKFNEEKALKSSLLKWDDYNITIGSLMLNGLWEGCTGSLDVFTDRYPNLRSMILNLRRTRNLNILLHSWPRTYIECDAYVPKFLVKMDNDSTAVLNMTNYLGVFALFDYDNDVAVKEFNRKIRIASSFFSGTPIVMQNVLHVLTGNAAKRSYNFIKNFAQTSAMFGEAGCLSISVDILPHSNNLCKQFGMTTAIDVRGYAKDILIVSLHGYTSHSGRDNTSKKNGFIRIIQLNTFLPFFTFSDPPWIHDDETIEIFRDLMKLRSETYDDMISWFNNDHPNGERYVLPIWWLCPDWEPAVLCDDEFLINEKLLVAPALDINLEETTRDIVLPSGCWKDLNTNETYEGPGIWQDYVIPLNILPRFLLVECPLVKPGNVLDSSTAKDDVAELSVTTTLPSPGP